MASELPFLQIRLRANENTVDQLRRKSAGHHHRHHFLCDVTSCQLMLHLVSCVSVLAVRLCNMESVMEELVKQTSGQTNNHLFITFITIETHKHVINGYATLPRIPDVQPVI